MNSITPFGGRMPAAFAGRARSSMLDAARANIQAGFPVLSYRGKSWRVKYRGDESPVLDAKNRPVSELAVVIVGVASGVSKTWYQDAYVPGADNPPDCFSIDGVKPDPASPKKQNNVCATCKQNQFGSRVTNNGRRAKACQDNRRLVVVPAGDILCNAYDGNPLMLRLPPMSLTNLANYSTLLDRRGADFPYVITLLGFDADAEFPRITFEPQDWVSEEQAVEVLQTMDNPMIGRMLNEVGPSDSGQGPAAAPNDDEPEPLAKGRPASAFGAGKLQPAAEQKVVHIPTKTQPGIDPNRGKLGKATGFITGNNGAGNGAAVEDHQDETPPIEAAPAKSAVKPRGSKTLPAALPAAPADLESAIDDLLDDN